MQTGDAPVCDPKTYYECFLMEMVNYVKENEASKCNCPRQCDRLSYETTISQSRLAFSAADHIKELFNFNGTANDIVKDLCVLEVC